MGHGTVSAVVRFLCHVPLFALVICGTLNYVYLQKHAQILLVAQYNKDKILAAGIFSGPGVSLCGNASTAQMLIYSKAIIAFLWNFFCWLPTIDASNKALLYYGLVDAVIVSCLTYALWIESTFAGFTRARCASVHANATADPRLLLFDRSRTIDMAQTGLGESICMKFLVKWYIMLAIT